MQRSHRPKQRADVHRPSHKPKRRTSVTSHKTPSFVQTRNITTKTSSYQYKPRQQLPISSSSVFSPPVSTFPRFMAISTVSSSRPALKEALTVTPSAAKRVEFLCNQHEPPAKGVRLGVRTRGCNGLTYTLNFADQPASKVDEIVRVPNTDLRLFIDNKALLYVIGTTMDFIESDVASEFIFNNPNSKGSCGCGESFTI